MFYAMATKYIRCGDKFFGINAGAGISEGKRYHASWTLLGASVKGSSPEIARGVIDEDGAAVVWHGIVSVTVLNCIEEAWEQDGKRQ